MPKPDNLIYTFHLKYEYSGGIALGVCSAAGIEYSLGSGINLLFEVNNKSLSYAPEEGELTEYIMNGINRLESVSGQYKKFSFKENIRGF